MPNACQRRFPYSYVNLITAQNVQISYTVAPDCRTVTFTGKTYIKGNNLTFNWKWGEPAPVAGTPLDSATQIVSSQGDTTFTTITHTYPPGQDTFFVNLTVSSDTLCGTGRAGIKVIVRPPKPTANFGFAATCNNLTVVFTDSSLLNTNPSITHQYAVKPTLAPPAAFTNYSTQPDNNYTFAAYDSFDVRLIVTSPISCVQQDTIVKRIVLKAKPIAGFGYNNTCGSLQATFINAATVAAGSITAVEYYLNNILIGSGSNAVAYNFPAFGSYTIKQVVKSNFNCISDTVALPIVIKDKPVTTLYAARDTVCLGTSFTITATTAVAASSISNYTWLRNGVLQPSIINQLTDNQLTGTYVYKAIATAATGCPGDTATKIITVVSKPTASFNATSNCGSRSMAITAAASVVNDVISSYYISYGDGSASILNPNNTSYSYTNFGTYTLKYLAKSSIGCASDTVYQTIVIKDKPHASLAYSNNACQNTNYTLTASASVINSTISSYTWVRNGIVLPNNSSTLTENNPAGNYTYKLVATSAQGCPSDTALQNVVVEQYPTANFTASDNCLGQPLAIINNSINNNTNNNTGLQYVWTTNDGQTSTAAIPNFIFTTLATKTIKLKVSTGNNCADSMTNSITVEAYPTADFTITEDCLGKPITIANNSTGAINSYSWQTSNGQVSSSALPVFTFNTEGSYNIQLQVATQNNCTDNISQSTIIRSVRLFTTPAADTNVLINQPLQLNITGAATYLWSPAVNLSSTTASSPIFTAATAGIYPYLVTGTTAQGCKGTAALTVKVFTATNYILIPNAFTPNGDGLNDRLRLTCSGLKSLTSFIIYNRWGQAVYQQNSCNQNNGWDGSFNTVAQPTGSFVYQWQGIDFENKKVDGKGSIILIR